MENREPMTHEKLAKIRNTARMMWFDEVKLSLHDVNDLVVEWENRLNPLHLTELNDA